MRFHDYEIVIQGKTTIANNDACGQLLAGIASQRPNSLYKLHIGQYDVGGKGFYIVYLYDTRPSQLSNGIPSYGWGLAIEGQSVVYVKVNNYAVSYVILND